MTMTHVLTRCCLLATTILASAWGAASTPSTGCERTLASGRYRMTDQNVIRAYRVFVPSRYKPGTAYPLVMVFHGWGGDENEFLGDKNVTTLADERGGVERRDIYLGVGPERRKRVDFPGDRIADRFAAPWLPRCAGENGRYTCLGDHRYTR